VLLLISVAAAGRQAEADAAAEPGVATPASPNLFTLLSQATEDQRIRALRFIENRYPNLSADLYALLQTRHPGIFAWANTELQAIISAKYPALALTVEKELHFAIEQRYPQVRAEIGQLIQEKYPELLAEVREGGVEGDTATQMEQLIREKHRSLLTDILQLIRDRHPDLLEYVQQQVIAKHPGLLADVAGILVEQYPELAAEVTAALAEKYPELLPGLMEILSAPPAAAETDGGAPQE